LSEKRNECIIETDDLRKQYEVGGVPIKALDGVSLKLRRGDYTSIMGPSGSGKTTLFNMIGGLDRPTQGRVFKMKLRFQDWTHMNWLGFVATK
jgi:putative ABC transport system ATP-binding protein